MPLILLPPPPFYALMPLFDDAFRATRAVLAAATLLLDRRLRCHAEPYASFDCRHVTIRRFSPRLLRDYGHADAADAADYAYMPPLRERHDAIRHAAFFFALMLLRCAI